MQTIVKTKVTQGGRVVIPAEIRKKLGIEIGDLVNLTFDNDELRIISQKQAIRKIQERFRKLIPEDVSLVDELIADRRKEAEND